METNRRLIDYLPPFIQEYIEMKHIMTAEQPEFDNLWNASEDVLNESFIMYASENGVKRWESIIGITPKDTDTLDERRFKILLKMNQELPYTMTKLEESLTTMCGAGNFSVELQPDKYHVEIKLGLANKKDYQEAVELLNKMIPANMTQHVQIMYNSHGILAEYKNAELFYYTHDQMRRDVLEHGRHLLVRDDAAGNLMVTGLLISTTYYKKTLKINGFDVVNDEAGNVMVRG